MTRQLLFPYLLNEQFEVGNRAPLDAIRAAQPGPGSLTMVQVDGEFSIGSGVLNFPVQATPAWGDQYLVVAAGLTRVAGRSLLATLSRASTTGYGGFGWNNDATPLDFGQLVSHSIGFDTGGSLAAVSNATNGWQVGVFTATTYQLAIVLRAAGAFHLIKGGAFAEWTLIWVGNSGSQATMYPAFSNYSSSGTLDNLRAVDLPLPWTDEYGIVTQRLAGAVAAGASFAHEANCLIEWTQTTRPSADFTRVDFRRQDASNYWRLAINSIGDMDLREVVAGVPTTRGTSAGVVASGDRIVIVADGTTIRVYEANTLRITYSSATNFATATAGEINTLGTGGVVSELISWPRTLSGQALSTLERV